MVLVADTVVSVTVHDPGMVLTVAELVMLLVADVVVSVAVFDSEPVLIARERRTSAQGQASAMLWARPSRHLSALGPAPDMP